MKIDELEKKVLDVIKNKKKIIVEDLIEKITIYELMHLIVLKEEFSSIQIVNVDLQQKNKFAEGDKEIMCPYFEIEKKGC